MFLAFFFKDLIDLFFVISGVQFELSKSNVRYNFLYSLRHLTSQGLQLYTLLVITKQKPSGMKFALAHKVLFFGDGTIC